MLKLDDVKTITPNNESFEKFIKNNKLLLVIFGSLFLKTFYIYLTLGIAAKYVRWDYPPLIALLVILTLFSSSLIFGRLKIFYALALNLVFSFTFLVDVVYNRYFQNIPSFGLLSTAKQAGEILPVITSLLRPSDLLFFADIVIVLIYGPRKQTAAKAPKSYPRVTFSILALTLVMSAATFFTDRENITKNINTSLDNKLTFARYGYFGFHMIDIYRYASQKLQKISDPEAQKIIREAKQYQTVQSDNGLTGVAKNKNIILIQFESLQSFVIGQKINSQEITPNLNSLISGAHSFENNYYVIGGGNTSDVDFVVNTSFYPLQNESVFVRYGNHNFSSLPKVLKSAGYSTYAYHANNRAYWNRDVAFQSLGYEKFYAQENYPKGEIINMGLNDKDFYSSTIEKIKSQPKPSFSYLITLSNHVKFDLPESEKKLNITEDFLWMNSNYLQSVRYADEALGEFFSALKKENLYDDSLLVVFGDHTAHLPDFDFNGKRYNFSVTENNKVPLVIKLPGQTEKRAIDSVTSEIDIMPTILNLAGVKTNYLMFGRDLFSGATPTFYGMGSIPEGDIFAGPSHFKTTQGCQPDCEKQKKRRDTIWEVCDKFIRYNLFARQPL